MIILPLDEARPPICLSPCPPRGRYFDMMKDIGAQSKSNAVFMNHSPAALQGLTQSVQAGFLSSAPIAGDMARR